MLNAHHGALNNSRICPAVGVRSAEAAVMDRPASRGAGLQRREASSRPCDSEGLRSRLAGLSGRLVTPPLPPPPLLILAAVKRHRHLAGKPNFKLVRSAASSFQLPPVLMVSSIDPPTHSRRRQFFVTNEYAPLAHGPYSSSSSSSSASASSSDDSCER